MRAHQHLAAIGAEFLRVIVQRNRKMRTAVDVHPHLLALAHRNQAGGMQLLMLRQAQGAAVGDVFALAQGDEGHGQPRSSGLPRLQCQGRIWMLANSPAWT
ncbi:hypothetical protein D3C76_1121490 [compost metagenome]